MVFLCDSDPRPPSRLGRVDDTLWARVGSSGVGVVGARGGAKDPQDVSHGVSRREWRWHRPGIKLGENSACSEEGSRSRMSRPVKKNQPPDSQADFYFKSAGRNPDS